MQNYIDPRLTVVFSKKFDVPIEKFFSKTLREKFDWAIKSVEEDCKWTRFDKPDCELTDGNL